MSSNEDFTIPTSVLRHFDLSSLPYTPTVITEISSRRDKLPGKNLFVDSLLALVELDGPALYPPSTPAGLRRLLYAIYSSPLDRLKRDCFFYYLLRDYDLHDAETGDVEGSSTGMEVDDKEDVFGSGESSRIKRNNRAEYFARKRCLPRTWTAFMDSYWELDHSLWESAVNHLSDPSITDINFFPQILSTLSTLVSPPSRACSLVHNLLTRTHRSLESALENDIKLLATCSASGISDAFSWIRLQPAPEIREKYREDVWCWALGSPRAPCGFGTHAVQSSALKDLLHLPLQPEENAHLIHFLSHPPRTISPPALSLLHDLVTLRLIHQGQYQESLQLEKDLAGSSTAGGRDDVRQRRRDMIREFVAILPEAQRRILLVDTENAAVRRDEERAKGLQVNGSSRAGQDEVDMEASWVDVPSQTQIPDPESRQALPAPTPIRVSDSLLNSTNSFQQSSPAQPRGHANSPFAGPPRFATNLSINSPAPSPLRIHSGSPFAAPRQNGASSSRVQPSVSAKVPKPIINDDHLEDTFKRPAETQITNTGNQASTNKNIDVAMSEAESEVDNDRPPPSSVRRSSRKVISGNSHKEHSPPPPPSKTPKRPSRATRQSTVPVMPGAFSVPEENQAKPTRATSLAPPDRAPSHTTTRSRITRSASRAVLDDHEEEPKRSKGNTGRRGRGTSVAASEVTDDGVSMNGGTGLRRSTRRGTTAGPSEMGSPTPSVGRSESGRRTPAARKVRAEGSMTPRLARSRR